MKDERSKEFEKFDDVMGKLLAVPYSELQRRLEAEKEGKAKTKKKRATSPASSRVSSASKKQAG